MGSQKACPWCGKPLEPKVIQSGNLIKLICSKCGWKIKQAERPQPKVEEKKPEVIEIRPQEIPEARQKSKWPLIVGGIVVLVAIILFVQFVLL